MMIREKSTSIIYNILLCSHGCLFVGWILGNRHACSTKMMLPRRKMQ
ncbi:hypothetical protein NC651_006622 [Populus alba x Populus x berolinensis]|nr:hypothetical protein NC651_006622 [Populus alba x Populus x berolinensis]